MHLHVASRREIIYLATILLTFSCIDPLPIGCSAREMKPAATGLAVNASADSERTKSRGCALLRRFARLFLAGGEDIWGLVAPWSRVGCQKCGQASWSVIHWPFQSLPACTSSRGIAKAGRQPWSLCCLNSEYLIISYYDHFITFIINNILQLCGHFSSASH